MTIEELKAALRLILEATRNDLERRLEGLREASDNRLTPLLESAEFKALCERDEELVDMVIDRELKLHGERVNELLLEVSR